MLDDPLIHQMTILLGLVTSAENGGSAGASAGAGTGVGANGGDWREALGDAAWARANAHAQVVITATGLAAWAQLSRALSAAAVEVDAVAGYSVGEVAACAAAGVFSADDAIALARRRAALMDEAGRQAAGGLCGVTGLSSAALEPLLTGSPVSIAIRNGEDSVVLGGPLEALDRVEAIAAARGARCTRLAVAVASHTPLMRDAAEGFDAALACVPMQAPSRVLIDSRGNRVWRAQDARAGLARQIASTVRWDEVMDQLAARGPSCVLEIGGGQALARLWQSRHPAIPARSADEFRTLDGVVDWIARSTA
ncbi:acyltransferase domain-containing protein [Mitsuaria sp. GD03876]|uniref:ACP S-malonyltransferase n=1 Tax=Mitsuaria sp. GD03876 TaxID=2975399 RepID=UPI0024499726|nr:acyltransferase domain-containing protein [Mitsuaria sp. GD03876]MDH0867330.1 acyltransferase domain-containing protein [Mitsuaria sp. GD03876]